MAKTPNSNNKLKITTAARQLFNKFGFRKVSVEEICQVAGLSKMTFYKHFKNKNELIKYLWQTLIDESWAKLDALEENNTSFREKIQAILKIKAESTSSFSDQYIKDYLNMAPELQNFYNQIFTETMRRFAIIIQRAQEKGELRKSLRPEFFLAVVNQFLELAKNEQLAKLYPNYSDFAIEINNYLYYGMMPVPANGK
ncbi:MAG: TetR/AcrR family transcriptional regulator [Candidatus Marinimicrobia bacterium]|nr:TetR/AcrR family transcriptional regulator [Candidatus Neomarinimicrobiota bacterium]